MDRVTFDEDGTLDEVVATGASVHLEHLDTSKRGRKTYMLIVETPTEHIHLTIAAARDVFVYERFDPRDIQK